MTPLQRRTLTLAVAGLGILAYRSPTLRRWFTPEAKKLTVRDGAPLMRILPRSVREKYVR